MKEPKRQPSSQFKGVHWVKRIERWCAKFYDSDTRTQVHVGTFMTELEATKALTEYNMTGTKTETKRQPTSHHRGVFWDRRNERWCAKFYDSDTQTQKYVGAFGTELEAVKALTEYKMTGAKRELTSHHRGVYWDRRTGRWCAKYYDSDTRTQKYMGSFGTELEAAKALSDYKMAATALMEMQASGTSDSFRKRQRKQNRHSISRVLPRKTVGDIVEEFEYRRMMHAVKMVYGFL